MKLGQQIAAFARAHAGCDQSHNAKMYQEAVVPVADRGTPFEAQYFDHNANLSTCALFGDQCLAAGESSQGAPVDLKLSGHYIIGTAVGNVQWVGGEHSALESYGPGEHPTEPIAEGDLVIIDGPPYGVHVIVNVEDAEVLADGRWRAKTVEGGQANGGVQAFEHFWEVRGGSMYPSHTSQRRVIAVIRARKFGFDTDAAPGEVVRAAASEDVAPAAVDEGTAS